MIIGIDLGTTNSLVAQMTPNGPRILVNELGDELTPSAVAVADDGAILVGRAAHDRLVSEPDSGIAFFKRDMGTEARYTFGKRKWSPAECSAIVLRELKRIAESTLGQAIEQAVITVPAYFHDAQRQATLEAAQIAGLKVERIVNEPTAAALAFGYENPDKESLVLVFDIGGGTFDVTLLEIFDGVIEIKASGGESRLGGEDYTDALVDLLQTRHALDVPDAERLRFRNAVEFGKRRLSKSPETAVIWNGQEVPLTRVHLTEAAGGFTARLRRVVQRCLRDAGVTPEELEDILLVGGASRMAVITQFISEELGRIPNRSIDPDRVVGLGAAVQAGLCGKDEAVKDLVLTDVCPHTLGVATARELVRGQVKDGYYTPLIDRNTTVPVSRAETFNTLHSQQNELEIQVFQGEARMVDDNIPIGKLHIKGLRARPSDRYPGMVEIRFSYDMNGILEVEVTVMETGRKVSKVFEQRPGQLSQKEIAEAIKRLAPLKVHPRDLLPNRARLMRADRLYAELIGPTREHLAQLVGQFEAALAGQNKDDIAVTGAMLDSFFAPFFAEEDNRPQKPAPDFVPENPPAFEEDDTEPDPHGE